MTRKNSRLRRTVRLLGRFWSAALAAEMEYRVNFLLSVLTSAGTLAGSLFVLSLFYARGGTAFAGWSFEAALLVTGVFTVLSGITTTFFAPNLGRIVTHVQEGTLDFVLLKPVDSQLWVSTHTISPWGVPDMALGLLLCGVAGYALGAGPLDYLRAVWPFACATVSLYSLWFLLAATSVWFVKIYNVTEVLRGLLDAGRFPIAAYPAAYRVFFTFVVPVAFLTTVPAEALLGRVAPGGLLLATGLSVGLFAASRAFWRFALRFYTRASS